MSNKAVRNITKDRDYWKKLCGNLSDKNILLEDQNEHYREALQYLYDRELEFVEPDEDVTGFIAEILGEALEGE